MNRFGGLEPEPLFRRIEYDATASCFELEVGNPGWPLPLDTSTFCSHDGSGPSNDSEILLYLFRALPPLLIVLATGSVGEGHGPGIRQCTILQPPLWGTYPKISASRPEPFLFPLDTFLKAVFSTQ